VFTTKCRLKNRAALEYECFRMLALGAACSVGDQLHPSGKLDVARAELVGSVYSTVEALEPWCVDASAVCDIGVLSPEEHTGKRVSPAAAGACRALREGGHQFDMVDTQSDLSIYEVPIKLTTSC